MKQKAEIIRLERQARRRGTAARLGALSVNDLAATLRKASDPFLASAEWKALRRQVLDTHGAKCMCCGVVPKNPAHINVDHVKPRRFYPELALDIGNLQVLCGRCNKRKGNRDTDFRAIAGRVADIRSGALA